MREEREEIEGAEPEAPAEDVDDPEAPAEDVDDLEEDPAYNPDDEGLKRLKGG
jgi:hypothetical protein